jgi:hypothetical protein
VVRAANVKAKLAKIELELKTNLMKLKPISVVEGMRSNWSQPAVQQSEIWYEIENKKVAAKVDLNLREMWDTVNDQILDRV